jgi:hypothetical protein
MSKVMVVLVVTLLLPGLVMLFAVVIRLLFRGAPRPPEPRATDDRDDPDDA